MPFCALSHGLTFLFQFFCFSVTLFASVNFGSSLFLEHSLVSFAPLPLLSLVFLVQIPSPPTHACSRTRAHTHFSHMSLICIQDLRQIPDPLNQARAGISEFPEHPINLTPLVLSPLKVFFTYMSFPLPLRLRLLQAGPYFVYLCILE